MMSSSISLICIATLIIPFRNVENISNCKHRNPREDDEQTSKQRDKIRRTNIEMTEQISHKKPLRRVNKEKRAQLKQYYKLEEQDEYQTTGSKQELSSESPAKTEVVPEDKPIEQLSYQELVRTHNKLLSKETETNNSIKNTIYENYYDLIKVNDLLKNMTGSNEKELSQLREAIKLLEE